MEFSLDVCGGSSLLTGELYEIYVLATSAGITAYIEDSHRDQPSPLPGKMTSDRYEIHHIALSQIKFGVLSLEVD